MKMAKKFMALALAVVLSVGCAFCVSADGSRTKNITVSQEQFKIYEVAENAVVRAEVVNTNGSGHGALAGFLMQHGVDTLICGGIGGGAQAALAEAGIKLYGGVSGEADAAVAALLVGHLGYNPNVHCDHHDHEHGEGGHTCGDHGCGHHSCH